ncbi:MAG: hypothetical protein Q4B09_03315 [Lachnospiraceae bacterium]|nr:hypothetical protein [Lachnospiraceae bacterium]
MKKIQRMLYRTAGCIAVLLCLFLAPAAVEAASYTTVCNGVDYASVYDYSYYCKRYPSVKSRYGGNPSKVVAHFAKYGMKDGKTGKDPKKFPQAKPGSATYNRLMMLNYYPSGRLTQAYADGAKTAGTWNKRVMKMIAVIGTGGGYSTGANAFAALQNAFTLSGGKGSVKMNRLSPSFCSDAVYMLVLKTLSYWNDRYRISEKAWINLRPYCVKGMKYPAQDDGTGAWGMANANGPGFAVLAKKLGAGKNTLILNRKEYSSEKKYWAAWDSAVPGDVMKIFRSSKIGKSEQGHLVIYLGRKSAMSNGKRDDIIYYWSSQKSTNGKGITSCRASQIYRAVLTKITKPAAFNAAASLSPKTKNSWLFALKEQKDVSVSEMKKKI